MTAHWGVLFNEFPHKLEYKLMEDHLLEEDVVRIRPETDPDLMREEEFNKEWDECRQRVAKVLADFIEGSPDRLLNELTGLVFDARKVAESVIERQGREKKDLAREALFDTAVNQEPCP